MLFRFSNSFFYVKFDFFVAEKKKQGRKKMIKNPANLNPKNLTLQVIKRKKEKTRIEKIKRTQKNLKTKKEKSKR